VTVSHRGISGAYAGYLCSHLRALSLERWNSATRVFQKETLKRASATDEAGT